MPRGSTYEDHCYINSTRTEVRLDVTTFTRQATSEEARRYFLPRPFPPSRRERCAPGRPCGCSARLPSSSDDRTWWESVLSDPRAAGKPWIPIQQRRLSEIPRELLRVECLRCLRQVELQRLDAIRLYGPHVVWKDVGNRLLDEGCRQPTGRHEEDGCWPEWVST